MTNRLEVNGQSIRYRTTGGGPNLLLLHTLRTQSEYFDKVMPELSKGFTIYIPDLHVTADSRTWLKFLAKEQHIVWELLRQKIQLKGASRLLLAFGKCFLS